MDWFMLLFYAVALYALTVSGKDRAINDITNGGSVHRRKCESGERGEAECAHCIRRRHRYTLVHTFECVMRKQWVT